MTSQTVPKAVMFLPNITLLRQVLKKDGIFRYAVQFCFNFSFDGYSL
jgi:hypothetical protein